MPKFDSALAFFLAAFVSSILISKYRFGTFSPPMEDQNQSPAKD